MPRIHHWSMLFASLATCSGMLFNIAGAYGASFRTIALEGQTSPGTSRPSYFTSFSPPIINNNGAVSFSGEEYDRPGRFGGPGAWFSESNVMSLIAGQYMPVPNEPDGAYFSGTVSNWSITDNGDVVFGADARGQSLPGGLYRGIWTWNAGQYQQRIRSGDSVNGLPEGVYVTGNYPDYFGRPAATRSGDLAMSVSLAGPSVDSTNDEAFILAGTDGPRLVIRKGSAAPGMSPGTFFDFGIGFQKLRINNAGQVAFSCATRGTESVYGIWTGTPESLELAVRYGESVPGSPGESISGFSFPVLSPNGSVAFSASFGNNGLQEGIGLFREGQLSLLVRTGTSASVNEPGAVFDRFYPPMINSSDTVLFQASLSGPGITDSNWEGIWAARNGKISEIVRDGMYAPGTVSGVTFSDLTIEETDSDFDRSNINPLINNRGEIVFPAYVSGPGIDLSNNKGYWAYDINGDLVPLIRLGDLLEVAPGDLRQVADMKIASNNPFDQVVGPNDQNGYSSPFNERGELAFWAAFTDGSSGILVVRIPEPTTVAFISVWLALAAAGRYSGNAVSLGQRDRFAAR